MSNGIKWAPILRYPGYEISKNHLVRNERTKRIVPQRLDPFDSDRRHTVTLVRRERAVVAFVQDLVKSAIWER